MFAKGDPNGAQNPVTLDHGLVKSVDRYGAGPEPLWESLVT